MGSNSQLPTPNCQLPLQLPPVTLASPLSAAPCPPVPCQGWPRVAQVEGERNPPDEIVGEAQADHSTRTGIRLAIMAPYRMPMMAWVMRPPFVVIERVEGTDHALNRQQPERDVHAHASAMSTTPS